MAVSKRTRYEVLKRDNHTCRYCGATAPDAVLTVDHVTPVALGGSDGPENLVAACRDCNYGKASTSPDASLVADVTQDAIRWAAAIKLASEKVAAKHQQVADYVGKFWDELTDYYPTDDYRRPILPSDWEDSIATFHKRGLPAEMLTRALAIAVAKNINRYDLFRYFCGVCWSMLTEIQEEARSIAERGDA